MSDDAGPANTLYAQLEKVGVLPSVCGRAREEAEVGVPSDVWSCRDLGRSSPAPSLPSDEGGEELPVVILTRDVHADGKWVTDLQAALLAQGVRTELLHLSAFVGAGNWRCLLNRVSDAAPPEDVKLCFAAVRAAELAGIPVINGTLAYSLACSKLLHYELFKRVGVLTPPYTVLRRCTNPTQAAQAARLAYPLLLKPNAAGFGAGISRVEAAEELTQPLVEAALGTDGVALLQEFAAPDEGCTYRVWFVGSKAPPYVRTPCTRTKLVSFLSTEAARDQHSYNS